MRCPKPACKICSPSIFSLQPPSEFVLTRAQVLRLLTGQELFLLVLSLGWGWLDPGLPVWKITVHWQAVGWGIVGALAMLATSALMLWLSQPLRQAIEAVDSLVFSRLQPSDFIYLAIWAGVAEEFFFRGVLQERFGLIPASILFGLVHIPSPRHWHYGLWATVASLYLGWVYALSGNLLTVMILHAVNNALGLWLWRKLRPQATTE